MPFLFDHKMIYLIVIPFHGPNSNHRIAVLVYKFLFKFKLFGDSHYTRAILAQMYAKISFLLWTYSLLYAVVPVSGLVRGRIKNLVTFGDSYTDVVSTGDNGTAWPVYAAEYGSFQLFPFAKSGATCSNKLTNRPAPSLIESQLPTYFSSVENGSLTLDPDETIYTLWIGTNDLGRAALLTGNQEQGVSLVDVIGCAVSWVSSLYKSGARNFLFQNVGNTQLYYF